MAEIEAAGGVVWRDDGARRRIAVVHRPRHDDWSLPKGKLDDGETHEAAAVREIGEETGLRVERGAALGEVGYEVDGRPKRVRYWAMEAVGGTFESNREVDRLRWLTPGEAADVLTYDRDRDVLARFTALDDPRTPH